MIVQSKEQALTNCRQAIEEKLGWSSSNNWSTQDFERLSDAIRQQTGVALSVTTLKRVWGRVNYDSVPTTTTLNALVVFAGYENWQAFSQSSATRPFLTEEVPIATASVSKPVQPLFWVIPTHWWPLAGIVISLGLVFCFLFSRQLPKPFSPADFSFDFRSVAKGVPNSVVFHYDATASPTDSVFIQQSWDPERRQVVPKNGHAHTSIYYYPGYYRAKLVVGKQTVQERDVIIPSDGWLTSVSQKPVPVYFSPEESLADGILHLPIAAIKRHNIPMQPKPPMVNYQYVRPLDGLRSDNFVFETRIKNPYKEGSAACQNGQITILCRNDFFSFPVSAPGCIGNLNMYMGGQQLSSKHTDLSNFGVNMNQWIDIRFEVHNKRMQLWINNRRAYAAAFRHFSAEIIGVDYQFQGNGFVDVCRFTRANGRVVFEDNFNG